MFVDTVWRWRQVYTPGLVPRRRFLGAQLEIAQSPSSSYFSEGRFRGRAITAGFLFFLRARDAPNTRPETIRPGVEKSVEREKSKEVASSAARNNKRSKEDVALVVAGRCTGSGILDSQRRAPQFHS